jgi:hypothetical protein
MKELQIIEFAGIFRAKTLYRTKLDPEMMEQVKEVCPHLLEGLTLCIGWSREWFDDICNCGKVVIFSIKT